jgi:urease accessory protein
MRQLLQYISLTALGLIFILPDTAMAHTGVGGATGFIQGFGHPLTGVDHLLVMLAAGLWAAQIGGRAVWIVPGVFVTVMVLGGTLGFAGVSLPYIEEGILLSVLALGVLIAGAYKLPGLVSALVIGLFALFHGFAHSAEMPAATGAAAYCIGFALATAMLHSIGVLSGLGLQTLNLEKVTRFTGATIALGGIYLAVA